MRWIALALLYLLYAGKMSLEEVVAACGAATVVGLGIKVVRAKVRSPYGMDTAWFFLLLRRAPARALQECMMVLGELLRSILRRETIEGEFVKIPFDARGSDPGSTARHALVVSGITFSPNSIAVIIDHEGGYILSHQLKRTPVQADSMDKEWPL